MGKYCEYMLYNIYHIQNGGENTIFPAKNQGIRFILEKPHRVSTL